MKSNLIEARKIINKQWAVGKYLSNSMLEELHRKFMHRRFTEYLSYSQAEAFEQWLDELEINQLEEFEINEIANNHLQFNCGIDEVEVQSFPTDNILDWLLILCELARCAGFVFTDAFVRKPPKFTELLRILSEIVEPKYMGINPNTQNHLYIWVVTKNEIINYAKQVRKNESKKASEKKVKRISSSSKK